MSDSDSEFVKTLTILSLAISLERDPGECFLDLSEDEQSKLLRSRLPLTNRIRDRLFELAKKGRLHAD